MIAIKKYGFAIDNVVYFNFKRYSVDAAKSAVDLEPFVDSLNRVHEWYRLGGGSNSPKPTRKLKSSISRTKNDKRV